MNRLVAVATLAALTLPSAADIGADDASGAEVCPLTQDPAALAAEANAALTAGDRLGAIAPLEALATIAPAANVHYQLGLCYMAAERMEDAVASFEAVSGPARRTALYNAACAHARAGDDAAALATLERALAEGFEDLDTLRTDPDLAALRDAPPFVRAVAELEQVHGAAIDLDGLHPRAQLDWIVGDWEVAGAPQSPWGQSAEWTLQGQSIAISNAVSTSHLTYVADDDVWRMTWVSIYGDHDVLEGRREGSTIVLHQPVIRTQPGVIGRATYENIRANSFQMRWDLSSDGGATWTTQSLLPLRRRVSGGGDASAAPPLAPELTPLAFRLGHWHTAVRQVRPGGNVVAGRGELKVTVDSTGAALEDELACGFDDFLSFSSTTRRQAAADGGWSVAYSPANGSGRSGSAQPRGDGFVERLSGTDGRGAFEDLQRYEVLSDDHWRLIVDRNYADGSSTPEYFVLEAWRRAG